MKGKFLEGHNLLGQLFDEPSPAKLIDIVEQILDLDIIEADPIQSHLERFKEDPSDQNGYDFLMDIVTDRLVPVLYLYSPE